MGEVLNVPLHLAVHVGGLAVSAGLAGFAAVRRRAAGSTWLGFVVGGLLLALTHVATGALVAVDSAWPLYLRAAGYAGIAVGAAGGLTVAAAIVVAPVGVHATAAVSGLLAAVAARGGVLGRGRQVAPLTLGLTLWAAGDLAAAWSTGAAAVLSLAGSAAGGWWLMTRTRESMAARMAVAFGGVLLVVVVVLASASAAVFSADLRSDRIDALRQIAAARAGSLAVDIPSDLGRTAGQVSGSSSIVTRLRAGESLDQQAKAAVDLNGDADIGLIVDRAGSAIGSYDRQTGAPLGSRETVLSGAGPILTALGGEPAEGLLRLGTDQFGAAGELLAIAAEPVFDLTATGEQRRDQLLGAVLLARRLTADQLLRDAAVETGVDIAIVVGDDLANASRLREVAAADLVAAVRDEDGVADLAGVASFVGAADLTDLDGTPVAQLVVFEDASVVAGLEDLITRALFLAAVSGGLLAALAAAAVSSRTVRPLRELTTAAERIAEGDADVRVRATGGRDEVGRLASAFDDMAVALDARESELRTAATVQGRLRARLEAITSSMNDALIAADSDGSVIAANPAAGTLLLRAVDELVGANVADILVGTAGTETLLDALGAADDVRTVAVHAQLSTGGRRVIDVAATAAPLQSEGGDSGRVYVLRDTTGEAQVERMKTEFISNISHELRTPLTPIKAYSTLLATRRDMPADKLEVVADQLQTSSRQLERIINMLVDFAALEAGRIQVFTEEVDARLLIDQVLADWQKRYPGRTFRRRVSRQTPTIETDPKLLAKILDELVDNARKFSADAVTVTAGPLDGDRVEFVVRDKGAGIPEEAMANLAEDFYQADGSATRHFGGLGLGLAIVERTLVVLDGDLTIESRVGQGTHARIVLPMAH